MTLHLLAGLNSIAAKRGDGLDPQLLALLHKRRDIAHNVVDLLPHLAVVRWQAGPSTHLAETEEHKNVTRLDLRRAHLEFAERKP